MSSESPTPEAPRGRLRRLLRIALGALALLVAVRVALPYAIPPLAEWLTMRKVGLEVRIANVDLGLLAGSVSLEGLWVGPPGRAPKGSAPADPSAALLAWQRVTANLAWSELVRGRIRLTDVVVEGPHVRVGRQADGRFDPLHGAAPTRESDPPPASDPAPAAAPAPPSPAAAPAPPPAGSAAKAAPTPEPAPEPEPAAGGGGWPVRVDTLTVRNAVLRLVDDTDEAELADFRLEELDLRDLSVEGSAIGLGGLGLRHPELRVQRSFLLDPTGGRHPAPEAAAPEGAPPAPATAGTQASAGPHGYHLDDLDIEQAAFQVQVGQQNLDLVLGLKADDITLERGHTFPFRFDMQVGEHGRLDLSGRAGAVPPSLVGDFTAKDLPLRLFALVARPDLESWLRDVAADAQLHLDLHVAGKDGAALRASGPLALRGFDLSDPRGQDLAVSWDALRVDLRELSVPLGEAAQRVPLRVHIGKVSLVAPKARYRRPSDALERLLQGPGGAGSPKPASASAPASPTTRQAAAPSPPRPPPEIRVDALDVKAGEVLFHDGGVEPAYDARVSQLAGTATGIDPTAPSVAHLAVDLTLNGRTTLAAAGRLGGRNGQLDVKVQSLPLPPLNPYMSSAGVKVTQGILTLDSEVEGNGAGWTLDNDVTLHDLSLDPEASKGFIDALGMPLGLVMAVLRDPKGDISLPVSLSVERGEMKTGFAELVVGAVRQALVGAASIPLKTIGGVLQVGQGLHLDPVPSAPGEVAAAPGSEERGRALVALLQDHPELVITLTGRSGKADQTLLALKELEANGLPALEPGPGFLTRQRLKGAIRARAKGKAGALPPEDETWLERYLAATTVPEERYQELARARAQALRNWLVTRQGIDAGRVVTSDEVKKGDPGVVLAIH